MENSEYCVLHEPFDGKNEEEEIRLGKLKVERFLKEIDEGMKDFRGVILSGFILGGLLWVKDRTLKDVDFSNAVLESVWFENCTFKGEIDFSYCKLSDVWFRSCRFEKSDKSSKALFWNASLEELTFMDCDFSVWVNFDSAEFKGEVSFLGTNFKKDVWFSNILTETGKKIKFKDVTFERIFGFSPKDGIARCELIFFSVVFKSYLWFHGITFEKSVKFQNCTFEDDLTFEDVRFEKSVEFRNCRFNGRVKFNVILKDKRTEFNDVLFQFCTFFNDLEFIGVDFKSNTKFIHCDFVKRVLFAGGSMVGLDFETKGDIPTQFGVNGKKREG